jgi:glycosyltransferase involved in cell wall biosynthesis
VPPDTPAGRGRRIRLAILDDNPFVRGADGAVRPIAATFHRFAEAVVAAGPFERADYLIPVSTLKADEAPSGSRPVDEERLRVVATAPFRGIAGYLSRLPTMMAHNRHIVRDVVARVDLVWIKAPASNAPLVAMACRAAGVPRFTWIAGSVRDVVSGQPGTPATRLLRRSAAVGYDGVTALLARTGPAIRLDASQFASTLERSEIDATRRASAPYDGAGGSLKLGWAGRLTAEKGLGDLLVAVAALRRSGRPVELRVIGDGPDRGRAERSAHDLGLRDVVSWTGHLADRDAYLDALRDRDVFVLSSLAEGFPKVLLDAAASGVPIVATAVGEVPTLTRRAGIGRLVPPADPDALAAAIAALADDPAERRRQAQLGLEWAIDHTAAAEAGRLVLWLQGRFPDLPWPEDGSAEPLGRGARPP